MSTECISFLKDERKKVTIKNSNNNKTALAHLSNKIIKTRVVKIDLPRIKVIKEKDNEYTLNGRLDSYISSPPKNGFLTISSNQNSINLQEIRCDYLNSLNNKKEIRLVKPFIDEINNIETDQLKNSSFEEIIESDFESENLKEIDPYISNEPFTLNKYKNFNLKNKNTPKNKKKPLFYSLQSQTKENSINHKNRSCNKSQNCGHKNINSTQLRKNEKKMLDRFNTETLKRIGFFSTKSKLDKKSFKKQKSEMKQTKNLNFTIDFSKIDNFKSNKKKNFEKEKILKIKKIKNLRNYFKKIKNDNNRYNSEVLVFNNYISNIESKKNKKIAKYIDKEKNKNIEPKNKTCFD